MYEAYEQLLSFLSTQSPSITLESSTYVTTLLSIYSQISHLPGPHNPNKAQAHSTARTRGRTYDSLFAPLTTHTRVPRPHTDSTPKPRATCTFPFSALPRRCLEPDSTCVARGRQYGSFPLRPGRCKELHKYLTYLRHEKYAPSTDYYGDVSIGTRALGKIGAGALCAQPTWASVVCVYSPAGKEDVFGRFRN